MFAVLLYQRYLVLMLLRYTGAIEVIIILYIHLIFLTTTRKYHIYQSRCHRVSNKYLHLEIIRAIQNNHVRI